VAEHNTIKPQPLDYESPRPRRGHEALYRTIAIAFIIFFALFLLTIDWGSGNKARLTANRVRSASNLRQIGQAILLYCNDHDGQYPDSFGTILLNEEVTSSVFVSPLRGETAAVGPTTRAEAALLVPGPNLSYVYLGRGLSTSTVTPNMVVAYEIPGPSGANVLCGDGHVEFITNIAPVVQQATTGKFPVTMPSPK
jgi:hypothetical protein